MLWLCSDRSTCPQLISRISYGWGANVALFNVHGHDGATNKSVISEHMQAAARYGPGHVHVLLAEKAAARAFPKRAADITYVEAIDSSGVKLLNCDLRE